MDRWRGTFLGRWHLPRKVSAFEVEVFFQFSADEARVMKERRRPDLTSGLALQIEFLRMSGRPLDAPYPTQGPLVTGSSSCARRVREAVPAADLSNIAMEQQV